jgi:signal peptidase I
LGSAALVAVTAKPQAETGKIMSDKPATSAENIQAGQPVVVPANEQVASGPPPKPKPALEPAKEKKPAPTEVKDGTREIIETIVFVVVLVLLLKTFLAEAFVIPTGSMAPTLLGYHKEVKCEKCGYLFKVNASSEVEEANQPKVVEWQCPLCRYKMYLKLPKQPDREDGP